MRPRSLTSEFRWLLAGLFLGWAQRVAPKPTGINDPDHDPYYDYVSALQTAGKAMQRLPS